MNKPQSPRVLIRSPAVSWDSSRGVPRLRLDSPGTGSSSLPAAPPACPVLHHLQDPSLRRKTTPLEVSAQAVRSPSVTGQISLALNRSFARSRNSDREPTRAPHRSIKASAPSVLLQENAAFKGQRLHSSLTLPTAFVTRHTRRNRFD